MSWNSKLFSIYCGFSPCFVLIAPNVGVIFHGWHIIKIKWHIAVCTIFVIHLLKMLFRSFTPLKISLSFSDLINYGNVQPQFLRTKPFRKGCGTDSSLISCLKLFLIRLLYQTMIQQYVESARWRLDFPFVEPRNRLHHSRKSDMQIILCNIACFFLQIKTVFKRARKEFA